jgi:hypothetical protein
MVDGGDVNGEEEENMLRFRSGLEDGERGNGYFTVTLFVSC